MFCSSYFWSRKIKATVLGFFYMDVSVLRYSDTASGHAGIIRKDGRKDMPETAQDMVK